MYILFFYKHRNRERKKEIVLKKEREKVGFNVRSATESNLQ